jgi:hypothetical protein
MKIYHDETQKEITELNIEKQNELILKLLDEGVIKSITKGNGMSFQESEYVVVKGGNNLNKFLNLIY